MENRIERSLVVPKKENVFIRFFKWVAGIVNEKDKDMEELKNSEITIPKAVQMPERIEADSKPKKGSLEYLYNLSDKELDKLDKSYEGQINEAKNELVRLNSILQSYKKTIKKFQEEV